MCRSLHVKIMLVRLSLLILIYCIIWDMILLMMMTLFKFRTNLTLKVVNIMRMVDARQLILKVMDVLTLIGV